MPAIEIVLLAVCYGCIVVGFGLILRSDLVHRAGAEKMQEAGKSGNNIAGDGQMVAATYMLILAAIFALIAAVRLLQ